MKKCALLIAVLAMPAAARAQEYNGVPLGDTIRLTDSVLSPTTPVALTRSGSTWQSAPANGVVYRFNASEGLSIECNGEARYFGGWTLASSPGRKPIVFYGMVPFSGPSLRAYGLVRDPPPNPPPPIPYVFWSLE